MRTTQRIHQGAWRQFLADRGTSQNELAGRVGVDRGYLSKVVNGHVALSWDLLVRLASELRVSPDAIACIEPAPEVAA